jgi:anti-anti-sigma factor
MPEVVNHRPHLLKGRSEQGVLILVVTEPHLRGDALVNALRDELLAAVSGAPAPRVILDFRPVAVLCSEAFRPLLSLRRRVQELGGRLVLCNLGPVVAQVFQATRLVGPNRSSSATFDVQPDLAAALASLTGNDRQPGEEVRTGRWVPLRTDAAVDSAGGPLGRRP